jgi:Tfp pilus assembly protein PilF
LKNDKLKLRKMKKLFILILLLSTGTLVSFLPDNDKLMPVTTNSKSALSLYKTAMKYFNDVNLDKALETFKKALDQDPDFFMANYQLAFFYFLNKSADNFEEYADAAINCKAKLTDAEELLKNVLVSFKEGKTNVIEVGKKLVKMFPDDPDSYNNLVSFQSLAGDTVAMVETLKKAITIASNAAPFYNQLGYAYLTLKQNDKAEEAFDKYIELDPGNPNVYDSKGDYYMYVKKYDKAYESYMRANSMDPSFSRDKAEAAEHLYEQTEGKKIELIAV